MRLLYVDVGFLGFFLGEFYQYFPISVVSNNNIFILKAKKLSKPIQKLFYFIDGIDMSKIIWDLGVLMC